jgi:hypothetical protein
MNIENKLNATEQIIKESDYGIEDLERFVENSKKFVFLEKFLKKENITFNQLKNITKYLLNTISQLLF